MRPQRSSARLAAFAATAALALALEGCSGAAAGPTVPPAPSSASTASTRAPASLTGALHQAGQCIRQHGIPGFADPTVNSAGQVMMDKAQLEAVPNAVAKQAVLACRDALGLAGMQSGHGGGLGGKPTPQQLREMLAFARCMRAHGLPGFRDPNPVTGEMSLPPGVAKTSPVVTAANHACRTYIPGGG